MSVGNCKAIICQFVFFNLFLLPCLKYSKAIWSTFKSDAENNSYILGLKCYHTCLKRWAITIIISCTLLLIFEGLCWNWLLDKQPVLSCFDNILNASVFHYYYIAPNFMWFTMQLKEIISHKPFSSGSFKSVYVSLSLEQW